MSKENKKEIEVYPYDMWPKDNTLLRLSCPDLPIDWESQKPTPAIATAVTERKVAYWKNPPHPITVSLEYVTSAVSRLQLLVQDEWKAKLVDDIDIQVTPLTGYLPTIHAAEFSRHVEVENAEQCLSPPTMFLAPWEGKLIIPENFIVRVQNAPGSERVSNPLFDIEEYQWDTPFFESVLFQMLSYALFRQLRGEWKEGYMVTVENISNDAMNNTGTINNTAALYAAEEAARKKEPSWGLYVVADKLWSIWQIHEEMAAYLTINALATSRPLSSAAMIDSAYAKDRNSTVYTFEPTHPRHSQKLQRFSGR